jgi:hypothetical protein
MAELEAALAYLRSSPKTGALRLIVRRPAPNPREALDDASLDEDGGLVGAGGRARGRRSTPDGSSNPEVQITMMNARCIELVAGGRERWALAGDQLFADLDLSEDHLPPGCRLALGSAVIEVTAPPHTGCKKFVERFGVDAMKFVNSPEGRRLRLRGLHARVVLAGRVRVGDLVRKA